jgi:tetratricopeptide (TPR) repeat protein
MMKQHLIGLFVALTVILAACDGNHGKDRPTSPDPSEQQGQPKDELALVTDSIEQDENRSDLYLRRANLYLEREQVGAAMMDVNRAITLDPKNMDAFLLLSDIYYLLGDETNITNTLNRALEVDPYDTRPMVKLAELNLLQQNYPLAFGYIDNALKINTFNPKAYFVRGMTFMARQDTVSALKNFMIAREQDADFVDPVREICKIYMAQEHPLTEQFLRESVERFPNEAMARYDLALFLQDHGAPEEALAHYDSLLSIQPENSRLLFNKGYVYFVYLGDNEKALEYFNRSLASDPTYLDALYNKGHVLEQMGDYVQAKDIYNKVLQQKPNYQLAVDAMNRIANQSE